MNRRRNQPPAEAPHTAQTLSPGRRGTPGPPPKSARPARGPAAGVESSVGELAGCRVLVVGLGRFGGGVAVTRWLRSHGARVVVTDLAPPETLGESVAAVEQDPLAGMSGGRRGAAAELPPVEFRLGGHGGIDPAAFDLVVLNPAVRKRESALFRAVVDAGVPWTTEINLFCERCPAEVIGVTGSFGKSTTCAMLAAALEAAVQSANLAYTGVHLGGNIGRSLLSELPNIRATDLVVLELSNAQLEDLPQTGWVPAVAVITNLFPHHLDRYSSFEEYVRAKLNIVSPTEPRQPAVVGVLHPEAESMLRTHVGGDRNRITRVPADAVVECRAPGAHNRRNAAIAMAVCRALRVDEDLACKAIAGFRGLPHRLEHVRTLNGVDYINDSKSTAPESSVTAMEAVAEGCSRRTNARGQDPGPSSQSRRLILIAGGKRNAVGLEEFAAAAVTSCRRVVCMGESGSAFAQAVTAAKGHVPVYPAAATAASPHDAVDVVVVRTLDEAVARANESATTGDTVLFSPGAPSFDGYANFAERGRHFVELVQRL